MSTTRSLSEYPMDLHRAIPMVFVDAKFPERKDMSVPYLCGKPGGGKTSAIRSFTNQHKMQFIARNISMAKLEEFGGIPEIYKKDNDYYTVWSFPELVSEMWKMHDKEPGSTIVLLLDDWHLANPSIQALGYECFTERSLKGRKFPPGTFIILAGNDKASAGAKSQFSATMNRVYKIYVQTNIQNWIENIAFPQMLYDPIISFLSIKEYEPMFHGDEDVVDPWPSPRSWTNMSTKIKTLQEFGMYDKLTELEQLTLFASYVGISAASKFNTHYKIFTKFNTKKIFETGKYKIPEDPIERFPFTFATASEFYNQKLEGKSKKCSDIYADILKDLHKQYPELAMASIRYIAVRDKTKILEELVSNKKIDISLLKDLQRTSTILGK